MDKCDQKALEILPAHCEIDASFAIAARVRYAFAQALRDVAREVREEDAKTAEEAVIPDDYDGDSNTSKLCRSVWHGARKLIAAEIRAAKEVMPTESEVLAALVPGDQYHPITVQPVSSGQSQTLNRALIDSWKFYDCPKCGRGYIDGKVTILKRGPYHTPECDCYDNSGGSGQFITASGSVWRDYARSDAGKLEYAQHEIVTLKEEIERLKGQPQSGECAVQKALQALWNDCDVGGFLIKHEVNEEVAAALAQPCPAPPLSWSESAERQNMLDGLAAYEKQVQELEARLESVAGSEDTRLKAIYDIVTRELAEPGVKESTGMLMSIASICEGQAIESEEPHA